MHVVYLSDKVENTMESDTVSEGTYDDDQSQSDDLDDDQIVSDDDTQFTSMYNKCIV